MQTTVLSKLTTRQREIFRLLTTGMDPKEVAHQLGITYGTFKVLCSQAYTRTGLNRYGLILALTGDTRSADVMKLTIWLNTWGSSMQRDALTEFNRILTDMRLP